MRFGILGRLLVHDGDHVVAIPAARQRVLLAAMLVRVGRVVPAGELAEMVWDGTPPPASAATLRTYVKRLRHVLGPRAAPRVATRYPGYLLNAAKDEVDLLRFTELCRDGGDAVRDRSWAQASALLGEALGLWRGAAMADVPSSVLQRNESARLERLRMQAAEWRIDADLHLGRDNELLTELQSLAAEHPMQERFHAQLMLALYRCDRQAEALAAYRHARRVLVSELGAEPGTELRELHQRILAADSRLLVSRPVARLSGSTLPRQLPAVPGSFTGRGKELAELTAMLHPAGQAPGTVALSVISGTAGVGKTALAVRWAHEVAHRFPDGQLYVNLRGYDSGEPMDPADALARLLRALDRPGPDIPPEMEERAALYRSALAERRVLALLDNARSAEQVRPLLPGGVPGCAVIVTSRSTLAGLVAREGAQRLSLDALSAAESGELLRALLGRFAEADPEGARALAERCCGLPLALRLAAELAVAGPQARLAELTDDLTDPRRRLDLHDAGGDDPRTALRKVFSWSYKHLDAHSARAFGLLGLHPGAEFDLTVVAALTGLSAERSRVVTEVLLSEHLVRSTSAGRYRMHHLLRAYAAEKARHSAAW